MDDTLPRSPLYRLQEIAPGSPDRPAAEQFVARAFLARHGARVTSFLPELLALRNRADELCVVAGYRRADADSLFLEQYLDLPVEAALSARAGAAIRRADIAEIGNLAGSQCRAARHLVGLLPGYLLERGQTWVVFTATSLVRTILTSVGASLLDLGPADGARLGAAAADWGAYYATGPRVLAGYLPSGRDLAPRRAGRSRGRG